MTVDPVALIFVGVAIVFVGAAVLAARRFARKQEREGRWDKNGPVHPTAPPGDWGMVPGYGAHRPQIEPDVDDEEPPEDAR
jgi:hypothetical protein